MSFGPTALRGFPATGGEGRVEYRLARNAVVSDFKKGRLSRLDVCDAHPELLRAAGSRRGHGTGRPGSPDCPAVDISLRYISTMYPLDHNTAAQAAAVPGPGSGRS